MTFASMMFPQKFFSKHQFISTALAVTASVAAVAGFVYAATTIGTNVSVDGNLTVSGSAATSTFSTGGLAVGTNQFVIQQTSGSVGLGTTTPDHILTVEAGNTNSQGLAVDGYLGSQGLLQNSLNNGMYFTLLNTTGTNTHLFRSYGDSYINSGNLGVGTTSPWGLLSVNPNALAAGTPQFVVGSSTQTSFVVTNSGNVGIGTAAPGNGLGIEQSIPNISRVDLTNANTSDNVRAGFIARASTATGVIDVFGAGNTGTMLGFANANVVDFQAVNSSALVVRTTSAAPIVFGTNSSERMRILSGGDIGIGTTTPYSRFHVSQGASATTTVNFGEVGSATSKACFNTKNVSGADISFYFSAANALVIENNLCR